MQEINKDLLKKTAVGMRLIALMTLFNSANFPRLRTFMAESLLPALLDEHPASARVSVLKAQFRLVGKMRVHQVIAIDKYDAVVLMAQEKSEEFVILRLVVESEYPHRITRLELDRASA